MKTFNEAALSEAAKQLEALEELMSERVNLEAKFRREAKELDAQIVNTRGSLAMALTMARTQKDTV